MFFKRVFGINLEVSIGYDWVQLEKLLEVY